MGIGYWGLGIVDRIFNCKYISDEDKNEIRRRGKMLGFIKYDYDYD